MKPIKIYNSLSNKIEEFKPIEPGKVSMYVCGPTVYNHIHLGNARPIVIFDVLYRLLMRIGYDVTYISNITDIDDRIINHALKENISEQEVADCYSKAYFKVREDLNALPPTYCPCVTQHMEEIIHFIDQLIDKGYAYESNGDVFFRVTKVKEYGALGNFNIEDLRSGVRIEENENKENPLDFALWKKTDSGIKWKTKWSLGRPGWHTECVVMINKIYPRGIIDIHGGGFDLKFPHHENEIAQSRAGNNSILANYWMHNGLINIDAVKMSKSLGNVKLAQTLIDQYGGNVIRWVLLSTHYRMPYNFSDEVIENAQKEVAKIIDAIRNAQIKLSLNAIAPMPYDEIIFDRFLDTLADDLNTANAQTLIYEVVKQLNQALRSTSFIDLAKIFATLCQMVDTIGIKYAIIALSDEEKKLFHDWELARANKDFAKSDFLRQQLVAKKLI